MKNRTTPELIKDLSENEIFVFGSNTGGFHGGGAAYYAHIYFCAEWGIGEGLSGSTYAIPTCDQAIQELPIDQIKESVSKFIEYAKLNPGLIFLVTPIGCGIAGFTADEIAPLFDSAKGIENIHLPESFWKVLN